MRISDFGIQDLRPNSSIHHPHSAILRPPLALRPSLARGVPLSFQGKSFKYQRRGETSTASGKIARHA